MERYIANIRNVRLFSRLDDADVRAIAGIVQTKRCLKGHLIFQEGEEGDALYIVSEGKIKVSLYDEHGREYILDTMDKGGFFGELSLIDGLPRSANVIAMEDSELLMVRRKDFIILLKENPGIGITLLETLSKRLRAADERIRGLAFMSVEARILKYLMDIAEQAGTRQRNSIIIQDGPSRTEIANSCGCTRETVSRVIKSLTHKGILNVRRRQYALNALIHPAF